jgi:8-oxo-dGTP pyrophosphatase MutT (NUDIX family)
MSHQADRKPAVSVIVRHPDDRRVLLVQRGNDPAKGLWAFPGGRVQPDESAPAAAAREVMEETGIAVEQLAAFRRYDLPGTAGVIGFRLEVFRAETRDRLDPVAADDAIDARWVSIAEALALPMPDSVRECLLSLAGPC